MPGPDADCTAMVTVFEPTPPIEIETGISLPLVASEGTMALTWYRPSKPGARPENSTFAEAPPVVTVGVAVVQDNGWLRAAEPVAGGLVTGPSPVQKICTTSLPAIAGVDGSANLYEGLRMAPCPLPCPFVLKIPGPKGDMFTVTGEPTAPFITADTEIERAS